MALLASRPARDGRQRVLQASTRARVREIVKDQEGPENVLKAIDDFAWHEQWMMTLGAGAESMSESCFPHIRMLLGGLKVQNGEG